MMASDRRVLCVGAAHWDIIGRSAGPLHAGDDVPGRVARRRGGVAANIAVGLAARWVPVSLCAVVGADDAGAALIGDLQSRRVNCRGVLTIEGAATDTYLAIENDQGDLFAAIADGALLDEHADALAGQAEAMLQFAHCIFLDANLPTAVLERLSEAARDAGIEIAANPVSPAKAPRLTFLLSGSFTPTLIANRTEAGVLLGTACENARDAAQALQARSNGVALVTDGPGPVALATPDGMIEAIPPSLPSGASVTGAGDALLAAFLASPHRQANPEAALRFAVEAAAEHMKSSMNG